MLHFQARTCYTTHDLVEFEASFSSAIHISL